jgi:hypothetical protein
VTICLRKGPKDEGPKDAEERILDSFLQLASTEAEGEGDLGEFDLICACC